MGFMKAALTFLVVLGMVRPPVPYSDEFQWFGVGNRMRFRPG